MRRRVGTTISPSLATLDEDPILVALNIQAELLQIQGSKLGERVPVGAHLVKSVKGKTRLTC